MLSEQQLQKEERRIQVISSVAFLVALASFVLGYYLLPLVFAFPETLAERLAFAAQTSVFILLWVVGAIGVVSYRRRKSAADIRGSAYAPPSPYIAVWVAFLQNTLEQAVIIIGAMFALATLLQGAMLSVLPVAAVLFGVGRIAFILGYPGGAASRAFGMSLTMAPALLGYMLALALIVWQLCV